MKRINPIVAIVLSASMLFGCKTWQGMDNTKKGAVIGVGGGAATGAIIGKAAGNTALGAIIGAAVGGGAGVLIGKKMDKQAQEIKNQVPNATVERVGEGINVTFASGVLFGFDKSDLTAQAQQNIKELTTILNKYPDTYVRVEGHTDTTGTYDYNMKLSERRAVAVSNFLKAQGVAANRVQAYWYGATQPVVPNNSDANKAKNRRVEFSIFANDKMKSDAKKESGQ
ncbi:OmpA family protein [Chitinophaga ginsengisoli]|uniref:Outer membrane protein OmpA-like peptidoglycan-associated protein n=1 Tax=Chitinophaga ginsengisoli TaxID=363837 RepID=A0A2P8FLF1_9BACT|nr:OmpA family protein [Chitinophaga ginsengisoli]PSL22548.1 outer membrane protein OmpA-like peptidoglycan-associated protein [Chitinophaga ginsengisoli]